jgi:1-aminocyclopropane-1-carboxylate deaminase
MISFPHIQARTQYITTLENVDLYLLREDEIHPHISGNKFRKLKYNLLEFFRGNYEGILSFGGAYSNHIAALAAAGKEFNVPTIGIIRGEELAEKYKENPTLSFAEEMGMKLHFVSRSDYRLKNEISFQDKLRKQLGHVFILPEGGTNKLAIKGCEEILGQHTREFTHIACAVGTGGTISGILKSKMNHQKILGYPALKDSHFLQEEIKIWSQTQDFELIPDYHFGGYGKTSPEFIDFINDFTEEYNVNLDPVYTGKMVYGLFEKIKSGFFPENSKILAVHTGGLQGIKGYNQKLKKENKPIII